MAILTERKRWVRVRAPRYIDPIDRLSPLEEAHVRRALRVLKRRYGGWQPLCEALRMRLKSLERMVSGRDRPVAPGVAIRVARLAGVPVDDVLSGAFPRAGACPTCGR